MRKTKASRRGCPGTRGPHRGWADRIRMYPGWSRALESPSFPTRFRELVAKSTSLPCSRVLRISHPWLTITETTWRTVRSCRRLAQRHPGSESRLSFQLPRVGAEVRPVGPSHYAEVGALAVDRDEKRVDLLVVDRRHDLFPRPVPIRPVQMRDAVVRIVVTWPLVDAGYLGVCQSGELP